MKTGRSRKYYLMEAVLILFNILINLIIFAVPLAVNQIINGKLALTDRVIAFIIGFMLLEICIQFVYLLIELPKSTPIKNGSHIYLRAMIFVIFSLFSICDPQCFFGIQSVFFYHVPECSIILHLF